MHASNNVIMTSATNPEVLAICYAQGWCASADKMTKAEAEAVASLGTAFQNSAIVHFDELQYFTALTEISDRAFQGTSSLTSVVFPSQITRIGIYAFINSAVNFSELPSGLTEIDDNALRQCSNLTLSALPSGLTSVGGAVFYMSSNVAVSEWVASAGDIPTRTFAYCNGITNFTIPSNVANIGNEAFNRCLYLATLRCNATTAPTLGSDVFVNLGVFVSQANRKLIVPSGATGYNSGDWQTLQDTYGYTLIYE